MTEYVRLSHPEKIYGEKKLLESQISLLTLSKIMKEFNTHRKDELALKISLKKNLNEFKESLVELEHSLPKSTLYEEKLKEEKRKHEIVKLIIKPEEKLKQKIEKQKEEISPIQKEQEQKKSIDEQIAEIKQKIASLRLKQ
ncbi:MAG: hypothetical protein N3D20_02245 [Candidatus Pacearchaeota archaeon]|nr:hypothetical protein [Candidatus Pacearchaeota archaeon]